MITYAFFAFAIGQQGPEKLTIDEALSIAMKNSYSVRIAENRADKARTLEKQARGAFGPTIGLQGNYSRFEGSVTGNGSTGGGTGGSTGGNQGGGSFSGETKSGTVSINQPIDISGLSHKALDATKFNRKAAEAAVKVEENNLKLNVRSAFYNVLLTRDLVKVQQDALTSAQARYDKAVIREREGSIPKFDVLRFENEVRKGEQGLNNATGNYVNAKHSLNNILSRPIETDFEAEAIDDLPVPPSDPTELVIAALKSRPEVLQSDYTIEALSRTADVQGASLAPGLSIQASHTRYLNPSASQTDQSTFGGIVISVPLFDSGITKSKVEAARKDTDQARISFEQLLLGISLEVRNALTQAQTAKTNYDVALNSVQLAAEALRLADIRYNEGAGILIDVTQAQADLTAAEGNAQNAKYQYLTAYANLLKALGKDDLNLSGA